MKHSWVFRWWYVLQLRKQAGSPFVMKNEVEALQGNCVSEIQQLIEPLLLSIQSLIYKLGIKTVQVNRSRIVRDELKPAVILPHPLFTQKEIARIIMKYWLGLIIITIFVLSETFLFWVVSPLFVPGGSEVMKISVALLLALIVMQCLSWGIEQHFKYRDLKYLQKKETTHEAEFQKQSDLRMIGLVLISFSIAIILFAGLSRVFFLEHVPASGLSEERHKAVTHASKWASLLTLTLTFCMGFLLAVLKRDQGKVAEQYNMYRFWQMSIRRRNKYSQNLISSSQKVLLVIEQTIAKHWSLCLDIKRILGLAQEFDEKNEQLNSAYLKIRAEPDFQLTEQLYRVYSPLQAAYQELFHFGINQSNEIKEKILFVKSALKIPEAYLFEQIHTLFQQEKKDKEVLPHMLNGKLKQQKILNT